MRIGVISDTHIPDKFHSLSQRVKEALQGVDLILHCGDVVDQCVLDELGQIAPVEAVSGNHDLEFNLIMARRKVVEVQGYRIGMIHGDELNGMHVTKSQLKEWLYQVVVEPFLTEERLDLIVFGHYHQPVIDVFRVEFMPADKPLETVKKDVLVFNPGMAVRNRHLSSLGFIELGEEGMRVEVKVFTGPREME